MPPTPHTSTIEFFEAKTSALEIFYRLTNGDIGVLAAAQKLSLLRHTLVGDARDEDWDVFVGIDSETDHLPLEESRKNWAPDALARKDVEIKEAEDFFRARAMQAAQNLIRRYEERD
jgi:hypothetical protein